MEQRDFYCIKCGRKGIPLIRQPNKLKEKFHRKKLYCPWCRVYINHVEVRNQWEADEFKKLFADGYFQPEVEESLRVSNETV